jgi:phage baseplate assembly protein W
MAINLGNVNSSDLVENAHKIMGIAINRASNAGGPFSVNYTTLTQAKYNLINLVLTKKGERMGQPELGCDIWRILFDPIIDGEIDSRVESTIMEAVAQWLPYIQINQIYLEYTNEDIDRNGFTVEIDFSLANNPAISDSVTINVNNE